MLFCLQADPLSYANLVGTPTLVFNANYRLIQVKSIAECSSILQYFRPSLSYHLSLRSLFLFIFEWPLKTSFTVHRGFVGIKCFDVGANCDIHEACNMFMPLNFYLIK